MTTEACILIVDDNPENIRVLGTILRNHGYHIVVAQDGEQALKTLDTIKPELILLDVMMPKMDGFEVCKRIKENSEMEAVSVIFLTAKTEDEDIVKGFNMGAADYISKPFKTEILLARVRNHLKLYKYHKRLQKQIYLDGLTSIPNRMHFEQVLETEWNRNLRVEHCLAVMIVDIDFFKRVNDDYGHLIGDEVLTKIAQILNQKTKRAGDFVARYGGEEFVLILPNTGLKDAVKFAELLRKAIEDLNIPNINVPLGLVTISLGVAAVIPNRDDSSMELVDRADKQLYRAKQQGRNQVQPEITDDLGA